MIEHSKKQLGICIEYKYISELMLWLHQGKFVNETWVKIPSLAAPEVAKYTKIAGFDIWKMIVACLVMKFRGYRHAKNRTPPTK